jgi:4-carboxymuconolactone decarboxylase
MTDGSRRLAPLHPSELDEDQLSVYRAIVGGKRAQGPQHFALTDDEGRLQGPFDAMLRSPTVGLALQALGAALRYGARLEPRAREMAILAVAARCHSAFERAAHEAVGRSLGLSDAELSSLARGQVPASASRYEQVVVSTALTILELHDLGDEEYQAAASVLDERSLVELVTLIGYYSLLALQLRVFRVEEPGEDLT